MTGSPSLDSSSGWPFSSCRDVRQTWGNPVTVRPTIQTVRAFSGDAAKRTATPMIGTTMTASGGQELRSPWRASFSAHAATCTVARAITPTSPAPAAQSTPSTGRSARVPR